ncbi:MAG: hypothetical protein KGI97_08015, partial [Alphaproteobacteria bacterium]|nr:hypothetical protein [Alphaproteobacteria bacterium]
MTTPEHSIHLYIANPAELEARRREAHAKMVAAHDAYMQVKGECDEQSRNGILIKTEIRPFRASPLAAYGNKILREAEEIIDAYLTIGDSVPKMSRELLRKIQAGVNYYGTESADAAINDKVKDFNRRVTAIQKYEAGNCDARVYGAINEIVGLSVKDDAGLIEELAERRAMQAAGKEAVDLRPFLKAKKEIRRSLARIRDFEAVPQGKAF